MGLIQKAVTLERGLRSEFEDVVSTLQPDPVLERLMMRVDSDTDEEKYGWLQAPPQLRQWIGQRNIVAPGDNSYTVQNIPFEGTIAVKKWDLRNDKVNSAFRRTRMLTERGVEHPQKLLIDTIIANTTCYDGVALFSNSHAEGGETGQDNLLAGSGTTEAQIEADLHAAIGQFLTFKDSEGVPLRQGTTGGMDLIVLCPPALVSKFRKLAQGSILSNSDNVLRGTFDFAATARLTDTDDWYIFEVSRFKPFVKQVNQALEFEAMEEGTSNYFHKGQAEYGVSWYGEVKPAWWQSAIKTTN